MNSDSGIPNKESKPNSSEPAEVNLTVFGEDTNPVLPNEEIDTVLHFISSPVVDNYHDEPHFISSSPLNTDDSVNAISSDSDAQNSNYLPSESIGTDVEVVESEVPPTASNSLAANEYQQIALPSANLDSLPRNVIVLKNNVNDINIISAPFVEPEKNNSVPPPTSSNSEINHLQINQTNGFQVIDSQEITEKTPLTEQKKSEILPETANNNTEAVEVTKETEAGSNNITTLSSLEELETIDLDAPVNQDSVSKYLQVQLKSEAERIVIILPSETQLSISEYSWSEIWQQLKQRLNGSDRFRVANTNVHLVAGDRLLDARQLQELAESLNEVQLQLKSVATSRRQTAIAAVTAGYSVEQTQPQPKISLFSESSLSATPMAEPLYMEMTIRSGVEIRHPGTVIILGDVNPGGIVVADGDILVWGRLRGVAHAGVKGNHECLIMAIQMEPTQLRIADAVARAPEKLPKQLHPEVAYITADGIRIAKATDFSRLNRVQ